MTNRDLGSAKHANNLISVMFVGLAVAPMVGCAGNHSLGVRERQAPAAVHATSDDDERSIHVELSRLAFDHSLAVRRTKDGVPHELLDGESVVTGDRIQVSLRTSEDAFVYLAFCSQGELVVFPGHGGIRTLAGRTITVPEGGDLVIDGELGDEVLYLIVCRADLSLADPRLAAEIANSRPRDKPSDCGESLDARLAKSQSPRSAKSSESSARRVLRGREYKKKTIDLSGAGWARAKVTDPADKNPATAASRTPPPDPGYERNPGRMVWYSGGGDRWSRLVVAADADGIAVVRYGFKHVAAVSP